jgi:predicted ArsR family transcriptional regulator
VSDQQSSLNQTDRLDAITSLAEPTRRAVYDFVAEAGDWVSRDQASDGLDLERGTVAHHLDRLAADGLLQIDYRRLSGRQGPGAGRPAKLYRRAQRDFEVSLPPRDYELAGSMLAEAVERSQSDGTPIKRAIDKVARAEGAHLAEEVRARLQATAGRGQPRRRRAVLAVLEEHGFEPRLAVDGTVVLRNCPFHQLAQQHTDLICNMNRCLLKAAIDDVGETGLEARLEPEEGICCVKLHAAR